MILATPHRVVRMRNVIMEYARAYLNSKETLIEAVVQSVF